ncbi:permease [Cutibacterium acnes JCM 18916]|nr:permease [Cutibacterium acnes JCM 18916]
MNLLITAYPIHTWLVKHKCPRWISATTAGTAVIVVLAAGVVGMVWSVAAMINQLQSYIPQMEKIYTQLLHWSTQLGYSQDVIADKLKKDRSAASDVGRDIGCLGYHQRRDDDYRHPHWHDLYGHGYPADA